MTRRCPYCFKKTSSRFVDVFFRSLGFIAAASFCVFVIVWVWEQIFLILNS